jgi:hypothetical protein
VHTRTSYSGPIILHGPHHVAVKSTTTRPPPRSAASHSSLVVRYFMPTCWSTAATGVFCPLLQEFSPRQHPWACTRLVWQTRCAHRSVPASAACAADKQTGVRKPANGQRYVPAAELPDNSDWRVLFKCSVMIDGASAMRAEVAVEHPKNTRGKISAKPRCGDVTERHSSFCFRQSRALSANG